jgi:hypothetical protein
MNAMWPYRCTPRLALFWLSVGLFFVSLALPVFPGWPGWGILIFGWLSMFMAHPANLTWLANPLLFVAWIGLGVSSRITAVLFSIAAFVVAGAFLFCKTVILGEDGSPRLIEGQILGYWPWLASTAAALAGALLVVRSPERGEALDHDVVRATRR